MTAFRVGLGRVKYSIGDEVKYLMTLRPEAAQPGLAALRSFPNDKALCEALERLGVPAPKQERILSVLLRANEETVPVDIPEEVAGEFGWPPEK